MALLTLSEFTIRAVSQGLEASKFNPFIEEAQGLDLREFLGDALYYDFVSAFDDSPVVSKYDNLLNGTTYTYGEDTILFEGLKMPLQYMAFARYLGNQETFTSVGMRIPQGEFSNLPDFKTIQLKIEQARSAANSYFKQAERFLNENRTTYTLWKNCNTTKTSGIKIRIT